MRLPHNRRVKAGGPGPFESTGKMLSMSGISKGWRVLDVACGTGAVAQQLLRVLEMEASWLE